MLFANLKKVNELLICLPIRSAHISVRTIHDNADRITDSA